MSDVLESRDRLNQLYEMADDDPLGIEDALFVLDLGYLPLEINRINDLMEKNRKNTISKQELEELDQLVDLGTILATMKSKARMALKEAGLSHS
jgi:hypothetical protein